MPIYTHWIIFSLVLILVPLGLAAFKKYTEEKVKPSQEQKKFASVKLFLSWMFYWLLDFFYMACFNDWLTLEFIFGGLIIIIIFYNLINAFLSIQNKAVSTKFGILHDFLVGVGIGIYLIYIIPSQSLKDVVIPIASAIFGGLLTLVGVAWTIKKSDDDRKKEEIKKAKPLFTYQIINAEPKSIEGLFVCFPVDLEPQYEFIIYTKIINSPNNAFTLKRIFHDGKWFELEANVVVLPSLSNILSFKFNNPLNIYLEVEDSIGTIYFYELKVLFRPQANGGLIHTVREIKEISKVDMEKEINGVK